MKETELKALVSLLEDDDNEIVDQIEQKIISIGSPIIPFLEEEWERSFNPIVQKRLEDLIHNMQYDVLRDRLVAWRDGGAEDLLEGLYLVATYQYPDLELEKLRQDLEQLYYSAWVEFQPEAFHYDQVRIMNSVMFGKFKFSGNTKNFHSPSNSMIHVVMESRKGNPITLSVIYMLIARKLGMPVYGINLPNLFILTYKTEETQFYINPFNRGLIFSREDIQNYVSELQLMPRNSFFEPCTNLEIVQRMLRNLYVSFEKLGEHLKSEELKLLLKSVSDGNPDYLTEI